MYCWQHVLLVCGMRLNTIPGTVRQIHAPSTTSTPLFSHAGLYRVQGAYVSTNRELKRLDALAFSPIFQSFGETLAGLATIRAFGKQQQFRDVNLVGAVRSMPPALWSQPPVLWALDVLSTAASTIAPAYHAVSNTGC
jgi:hypothetical protein